MFFCEGFSSKRNQQPTTNNHNNQQQTLAIFVPNPALRFPENLRLPQVVRHGRLDHIAGTHRIIDTQRPQEHGNRKWQPNWRCGLKFQLPSYSSARNLHSFMSILFFLQSLGFLGEEGSHALFFREDLHVSTLLGGHGGWWAHRLLTCSKFLRQAVFRSLRSPQNNTQSVSWSKWYRGSLYDTNPSKALV